MYLFFPPLVISRQQLEGNHKSVLLNNATLHQQGFLRNKRHVALYTNRLPTDTELQRGKPTSDGQKNTSRILSTWDTRDHHHLDVTKDT